MKTVVRDTAEEIDDDNLTTTVEGPKITVDVFSSSFKCHGDRIKKTVGVVKGLLRYLSFKLPLKERTQDPVPHTGLVTSACPFVFFIVGIE